MRYEMKYDENEEIMIMKFYRKRITVEIVEKMKDYSVMVGFVWNVVWKLWMDAECIVSRAAQLPTEYALILLLLFCRWRDARRAYGVLSRFFFSLSFSSHVHGREAENGFTARRRKNQKTKTIKIFSYKITYAICI